VLTRRWIVEWSLSWITQARRPVQDYERLASATLRGPDQLDRHHPDDPAAGSPDSMTSRSVARNLATATTTH
jgi:hypothetical protein